MKYATIFSNLWKTHGLLQDKATEKYSLMEAMAIYLIENTKDNTLSQDEIDKTDFIKMITDAGHGEALQALYRILF